MNDSLPRWQGRAGWALLAQSTARTALTLSTDEEQSLRTLAASRTAAVREVQRARILLGYHAGESFSALSRTVKVSRRIVYKHVDRALAAGVSVALRDRAHGSAPTILPEARAWVVALACTKPKEHGHAAELWTLSALAKHVRGTAKAAGHPSAAQMVKSTVHAMLRAAPLRPHKIKYYLERRDPEFERKMQEVLIVYREVAELAQHPPAAGTPRVVTVSVAEKPGGCRPWRPPASICPRCPARIQKSAAIMNPNASARPRFWPAWICRMDM